MVQTILFNFRMISNPENKCSKIESMISLFFNTRSLATPESEPKVNTQHSIAGYCPGAVH